MTRPPAAATEAFDVELERLRRLVGLQVDTVTRTVQGVGDLAGWDRLTAMGTAATVDAQQGARAATTRYLEATLDAAGVPSAGVSVPIQPGLTVSGRPVSGMFAATQGVVTNRISGGDTFDEALDHSAHYLVGQAASEPHRIGRDGQLSAGLTDERFGRFRRVAEPGACPWCRMLATRGAVYLTAQTAGQGRKYHPHDRCLIQLEVSEEAISKSKALSTDWHQAILDEDRMRRAGAMSDDLPKAPAVVDTRPQWRRDWDDAVARLPEDRSQISTPEHLQAVIDSGKALDDELERRIAARAGTLDTSALKAAEAKTKGTYDAAVKAADDEFDAAWDRVVAANVTDDGKLHMLKGMTRDEVAEWAQRSPTGFSEDFDAKVRAAKVLHYRFRLETETSKAAWRKLKIKADAAEKRWKSALSSTSDVALEPGTAAYASVLREESLSLLAEIREMGGQQVYRSAVKNAAAKPIVSGDTLRAMRFAEEAYPAQWHDALKTYLQAHSPVPIFGPAPTLEERAMIRLGNAKRGYNRGAYEIKLSTQSGRGHLPAADTKANYQVATHELGHSFENAVPGLKQLEWLYSRHRAPRATNKIEPIYGPSEKGYKDDWATHYVGKVYKDSPGSSWEIFTMGIESLMAGSPYLERETLGYDREFRQWLLGVLSAL